MAAAPVWHDYMAEAHKSLPKEDFSRPDNVKDCSIAKYSNKKPTDKTSSENIVRDLCADFQLSDQADDTSFVVKLYKPDQTKLATDSTPSGLVFEKTFFKIRSERPNDPIWENPVQKWARDNGINQDQVPTDKYDENTSNDKLDISILSPLSDATVSGTIGLQALTSSPFGVDLMTFYLDDIQLAQPEAPWIYNINTLNFTNGKHTFKATSHDAQGQEASASVSFTIANTTGSLSLSSITAQRSGTSVVLTWTSSDLADGTVKYGLTNAYGSIQAEGKGQLTAHSVTIAGLTAGTTYHYQIVSTNSTSSAQSADLTF